MSILNQYQISSSTCIFSAPVNHGGNKSDERDVEYSVQNCFYEFGWSTPTTTVPVTFEISTSSATTSSSTDFYLNPEFTGGDIIIILIGILFVFFTITSFVIKAIDGIQTKRRYISYNGGDVEIRDDL